MEYFTLNDGTQIPKIGTGTNTFGKENNDYMGKITGDTKELLSAFDLGYRLIDTAISYRNESVVGAALKATDIARDDFYVTTKIPGESYYVATEAVFTQAIDRSIEALGLDCVDLFLIHHPWENTAEMLTMYRWLEAEVDKGRIRSLGVSNFDPAQLQFILDHARIKPVVNQIESHPGNWNNEIIEFSKANDVIPEAWGPLKRIPEPAIATLTEIAATYKKTWSQVLLRYQIERGVLVIPKAHNPEHQRENIELFDFSLRPEDTARIDQLD